MWQINKLPSLNVWEQIETIKFYIVKDVFIQCSRGSLRCLSHIGMWTHMIIISYAWNLLRRPEMVCFSIHSQVTVQPKNKLLSASTRTSSSCSWLRVAWARVVESSRTSLQLKSAGTSSFLGHLWPRSFIQTMKCSFFNQIIAYQSFYVAPLLFSYFLLQGKVLCFAHVGKSARCLMSKAFRRPGRKNYNYFWLCLTQIAHSNSIMLFL